PRRPLRRRRAFRSRSTWIRSTRTLTCRCESSPATTPTPRPFESTVSTTRSSWFGSVRMPSRTARPRGRSKETQCSPRLPTRGRTGGCCWPASSSASPPPRWLTECVARAPPPSRRSREKPPAATKRSEIRGGAVEWLRLISFRCLRSPVPGQRYGDGTDVGGREAPHHRVLGCCRSRLRRCCDLPHRLRHGNRARANGRLDSGHFIRPGGPLSRRLRLLRR